MADSKKSSTSDSQTDDYEVGYGKPPKHTQFRPGQSGNPKGRPKGSKNLKTELAEVLAETVVVREGDVTRKVSKRRALLTSQANRAIKGDAKSAALITALDTRLLGDGDDAVDIKEIVHEDDRAVVETLKTRLLQKQKRDQRVDERSDQTEGDES